MAVSKAISRWNRYYSRQLPDVTAAGSSLKPLAGFVSRPRLGIGVEIGICAFSSERLMHFSQSRHQYRHCLWIDAAIHPHVCVELFSDGWRYQELKM